MSFREKNKNTIFFYFSMVSIVWGQLVPYFVCAVYGLWVSIDFNCKFNNLSISDINYHGYYKSIMNTFEKILSAISWIANIIDKNFFFYLLKYIYFG